MNSIKKGLGRGLSSLIGETKVEPKTNKLPLREIVPNRFQPRKNFDEESLEDLSNSNSWLLFGRLPYIRRYDVSSKVEFSAKS